MAEYTAYQTIMGSLFDPLYMVFPWLHRLPTQRNKRLRESVDTVYNLLSGAVQARIKKRQQELQRETESDPEARDILDLLLPLEGGCPMSGPSDPNKLEMREIIPNLWIFFIAGHDTTAISLAWLLDTLAQHPPVQDRLREEVHRVFGDDPTAVPTRDQLEGLEYMDAVVKEGLRMHPPVHNLMTRAAAEDTDLGGYQVKKGTMVAISISSINRHPEVWDRPDEFDPDRFLESKPKRWNWIPFSVGPRRCLGDRFSMLEQKTLLTKLLSHYRVLPQDGDGGRGSDRLALAKTGMPMLFKQPSTFAVRFQS